MFAWQECKCHAAGLQGTLSPSPVPVLEALLAQLLDHMRKGTGRAVYDAVIALAGDQLKAFESCGAHWQWHWTV